MTGPMLRSLTFGGVAEAYQRFRLPYPPELVDEVLAYALPPLRSALEVGAGTGHATTLFAGRGVEVTVVEPDPRMLEVLARETDGMPVRIRRATFEELGPEQGPVDLLYAASSWHWTDPATRWERATALLRRGGTFASFGGGTNLADAELAAAVEEARRPWVPEDGYHPPEVLRRDPNDGGIQWPGSDLVGPRRVTDDFTHVAERVVLRRTRMPAEDYLGALSTLSSFLILTPADRADALSSVREVLPHEVDVNADVTVHLARRV